MTGYEYAFAYEGPEFVHLVRASERTTLCGLRALPPLPQRHLVTCEICKQTAREGGRR